MNNYKDLKIWQKAVGLVVKIYEMTHKFPNDELYGLTSQIRRCAVSIPSNIAEGSGRNTKNDFKNFLGISYASTCELETQLIIANRIHFIDDNTLIHFQNEISEIQKMTWSLKKSLTQDSRQ
jgi:four helix bundle protein